jgi:hypothetical protein
MVDIDYKELLENSFERSAEFNEPVSHLGYLASAIFGIDTYDTEMDDRLASKAVEVADAITNSSTFEYIRHRDDDGWFEIMLHFPFFADRTSWGTSIRGAWWAPQLHKKNIEFSSCEIYAGDAQWYETLEFTLEEWEKFMRAVVNFAKESQ